MPYSLFPKLQNIPHHIVDAAEEIAAYFDSIKRPLWRVGRIQSYVPLPPPTYVDIELPLEEKDGAHHFSNFADLSS